MARILTLMYFECWNIYIDKCFNSWILKAFNLYMLLFGSQNLLPDVNLALKNSYWTGIRRSYIKARHLTQADHFQPLVLWFNSPGLICYVPSYSHNNQTMWWDWLLWLHTLPLSYTAINNIPKKIALNE